MFKFFKMLIILIVFLSAALALYFQYIGHFDPVEIAVNFKEQGDRDQALDVIEFSRENNIGDQQRLADLNEEYEYGFFEKNKDLFYQGAIKGEVYNTYSGIGCIAADLVIVGDVRDLTKESINLATGKNVDYVVAALSTIGIGTAVAEVSGVGTAPGVMVDAGASVLKTSIKFITKTARKIPDSILKTVLIGKKVGISFYEKLWSIFKSTNFSIPSTVTILSKLKDFNHLDSAVVISKKAKKGAVLFISKTGDEGFKAYETFKSYRLGDLFAAGIKRNPKGVFGVTKFNTIIHSIKFLEKHGFLIALLIILSLLASIFAMLPAWISITIFVLSGGFLGYKTRKSYKALRRKKYFHTKKHSIIALQEVSA